MSLAPDLKARVLASTAELPAPTRTRTLLTRLWLLAGGVIGAVAVFLMYGGMRPTGRPPLLMLLTTLGTSVIAGVGMYVLYSHPARSMLRRRTGTLVVAAALAVVAFVVWRYSVSLAYDSVQRWPTRPGLKCLGLGLLTGALPLFAALIAWRRTDPLSPAATGAAFGAGAGLGSAVLSDLWCPVSYPLHLLLGHVMPVILLAFIGGAVGRLALSLRRR
jgi:hypothetical protein